MSDFDDSDSEFQGFELRSPQIHVKEFLIVEEETPKIIKKEEVPRKFESEFVGSFLGESPVVLSKETAFGEAGESEVLDWDASTVFNSLACPENNLEKSVCVIRLHDVLTKSEMGVHKMKRQLIHCGQLLDEYSPQQRRDLGFDDSQNVKNLLQMIRAFRSTVKIMLIDVEDLQDQITQEAQDETPIISKQAW